MADPSLLELRAFLLRFLGDYAAWNASKNTEFVALARRLTEAAHEALGGTKGTRPVVADPFAGGGAIPLEALRAGADVVASDINPVAVLLNKVALEYAPKYGLSLPSAVAKAAERVSSDVSERLKEYFPVHQQQASVAYLWARTALCEGPGCGKRIPLMRSLWLANAPALKCALSLRPEGDGFAVQLLQNPLASEIGQGTVKRSSATCPACGYTTPAANVRSQFKERRGGTADAQLLAVAYEGASGQLAMRLPTEADHNAIESATKRFHELAKQRLPEGVASLPDESFPYLRSIFNIKLLGVEQWVDLFTARQAVVISAYCESIRSQYAFEIANGSEPEKARAVCSCLALALDKVADFNASLCMWRAGSLDVGHVFGRQALGIVWDFVESNPMSGRYVDWSRATGHVQKVLEELAARITEPATVLRASATESVMPQDSVDLFFTDPPYYDMVPYADLSDFFYVWLKRSIGPQHPELFAEEVTPKRGEIVQLAERNVDYAFKTRAYYEDGMRRAFESARGALKPGGLAIVVFAHKETATWESQLSALVSAGWTVVGSWPIDTEMGSRLRAQNSAVLGSSIHLVCRPREHLDGSLQTDTVGNWRDVLAELPSRIHHWMPRLAAEGVVGADAIFACLGPALEIFSRYARVERANGETVSLLEYLEHVWAAVSREALSMIFEDPDTAGLDEDARVTSMWLWTIAGPTGPTSEGETQVDDDVDESTTKTPSSSGFALEYDAARKIAQGLGASLESLGHVVQIKGDTATLISVAERTKYLFGGSDGAPASKQKTKKKVQRALFEELDEVAEQQGWGEVGIPRAGSTVLDRVHQSMILFGAGRGEALKRFLVEEGVGRSSQFWKLAQALSALYPYSTDEKRWVDGVLARKKAFGF